MHLPSLIAVGFLGACVVAPTDRDATVTVAWEVHALATGEPVPCPVETARVTVQPQNRDTRIATVACDAGLAVSIPLPPGVYSIQVDLEDFAMSLPQSIDVGERDQRVATTILVDGGYFHLAWQLVGATSGMPLTCADGAGTDLVRIAATSSAGTFTDQLLCDAAGGFTSGLPAGDYQLAITAARGGETIGAAPVIAAPIATANRVTELGTIQVPIAGR